MRRLGKLAVVALALVAGSGCHPLDDTMVAIFGRSMRDQRSFDPYENTVPPPEHSVAFSSGNTSDAINDINVGEPGTTLDIPPFTQADMLPIGTGDTIVQSLENPFARDDSLALARGEEMYNRVCVVCHGPQGLGAQAYIVDKHPTLAAYNLSGPQVAGYSDQYIFGMMTVGRGLMPPWAHQIRPIDRWAILTYVRKLQADAGNASGGGE
jgi:mono/diheme cytochrome c family protein